MINRKAFLLLELLLGLVMLALMLTFFSYFLFIIIQTRELTVKRLQALNCVVNVLENNKNDKNHAVMDKNNGFFVQTTIISVCNNNGKKLYKVTQAEAKGQTSLKKDFCVGIIGNAKKA